MENVDNTRFWYFWASWANRLPDSHVIGNKFDSLTCFTYYVRHLCLRSIIDFCKEIICLQVHMPVWSLSFSKTKKTEPGFNTHSKFVLIKNDQFKERFLLVINHKCLKILYFFNITLFWPYIQHPYHTERTVNSFQSDVILISWKINEFRLSIHYFFPVVVVLSFFNNAFVIHDGEITVKKHQFWLRLPPKFSLLSGSLF